MATGSVYGSVVDARSRKGIADARVILDGGLWMACAITFPDGCYIIDAPPGSAKMQVQADGYRSTDWMPVKVPALSFTNVEFALDQFAVARPSGRAKAATLAGSAPARAPAVTSPTPHDPHALVRRNAWTPHQTTFGEVSAADRWRLLHGG